MALSFGLDSLLVSRAVESASRVTVHHLTGTTARTSNHHGCNSEWEMRRNRASSISLLDLRSEKPFEVTVYPHGHGPALTVRGLSRSMAECACSPEST